MTRLFDAAPAPGAPRSIVGKPSDAFDDVPMPFEGQVAERLEVIGDKGLAVQDDREEMDR
jgi:hypothetical protein